MVSLVTRVPTLSDIGVTSSPLYACPPEAGSADGGFQIGDELWDRFTGGRQGTIWHYRELSEIFQRLLHCPLADGLSRTVFGFFPSINFHAQHLRPYTTSEMMVFGIMASSVINALSTP